jgi:hypothetical protein
MYSFLILTANNCQEMPSIESLEDESKLMINIKVMPITTYLYIKNFAKIISNIF